MSSIVEAVKTERQSLRDGTVTLFQNLDRFKLAYDRYDGLLTDIIIGEEVAENREGFIEFISALTNIHANDSVRAQISLSIDEKGQLLLEGNQMQLWFSNLAEYKSIVSQLCKHIVELDLVEIQIPENFSVGEQHGYVKFSNFRLASPRDSHLFPNNIFVLVSYVYEQIKDGKTFRVLSVQGDFQNIVII